MSEQYTLLSQLPMSSSCKKIVISFLKPQYCYDINELMRLHQTAMSMNWSDEGIVFFLYCDRKCWEQLTRFLIDYSSTSCKITVPKLKGLWRFCVKNNHEKTEIISLPLTITPKSNLFDKNEFHFQKFKKFYYDYDKTCSEKTKTDIFTDY